MLKRLCPLLICGFLICTACTRLPEAPIDAQFEGVETALDRSGNVSLFAIHGMGGYSEGDPQTLLNSTVHSLGLYEDKPPCVRKIIDPDTQKLHGVLTRRDYRGSKDCRRLRTYALNWEESTIREKSHLQWIDQTQCSAQKRVYYINKAKEAVINDGLADAVMYISNYYSEIQYPIIQSIRWILEDNEEACQHEIVVVGYSLGGPITLDTLDTMRGYNKKAPYDPEQQQIADAFIDKISAFFFLSNPYPLVELTEIKPNSCEHRFQDEQICEHCISDAGVTASNEPPSPWKWEHSTLGRFIHTKRMSSPGFQIVSMGDPNDLMNYHPDYYYLPSGDEGEKNAFANVLVRNAKWSFYGLTNPVTAHTGYGKNDKVLGLVIFGTMGKCCDTTCYK